MEMNPLLCLDYYKTTHHDQYPKELTRLVSYYTPRMSRLPNHDKVVMFGLQAFIKEYLIEGFQKNFFSRPLNEVVAEYSRILDATLGKGAYDLGKVISLHKLGYLPLEIRAIPEGSLVDIKVPLFEVTNTHPEFVWLVNTIETAISCTLWHTMLSANVGYEYRQIVNEFYAKTVDNDVPRARALGDFSMRGQESVESAAKSSAAFCLSFLNTATVPAVMWLERYYNANCQREPVAYGAISTEHSVMCSNKAIDGDEKTFLKRLLTEIYPNHSFSVVCDSYDYWNVVENILPSLREEILQHNGCMSIRGDSGDPVDIVTKTVFALWKTFGGTVNIKGYKVLDPHVKAIYGDSITPDRCRRIYEILTEAGFACNNVSLGVGSFSMQCQESYYMFDRTLMTRFNPYTRDTFGVAIKATYAEDKDGKPIPIFKNPKTDTGHFKKSQRGCCSVHYDGKQFTCIDGLTYQESCDDLLNIMKPVFRNGEMVREFDLKFIRRILHKGHF